MSVHVLAPIGSTLFMEGDAPRGVSILCVGRVKLTRTSRSGKILLVRIAKPGDVLGLSAALGKTVYEVTAETLDYVQMKTFRRNDFLQFLDHHIEGTRNAANGLNTEYRAALTDASRLALLSSVSGRVAHLLIEMAAEAGTLDHPHPVVHMPLKHTDLAAMMGSSRESISRILQEFRRKGILTIQGTTVTIQRKYALESML